MEQLVIRVNCGEWTAELVDSAAAGHQSGLVAAELDATREA